MTGVLNWMSPIVTSGMRRADSAKSSRGTAVTTPDRTSSTGCSGASSVKVPELVQVSHPMIPTARGASRIVSAERDCRAGRVAPTLFLISP